MFGLQYHDRKVLGCRAPDEKEVGITSFSFSHKSILEIRMELFLFCGQERLTDLSTASEEDSEFYLLSWLQKERRFVMS